MAELRGHEVVNVRQSNSRPPTCFGLPGSGGLTASWSNCDFAVHVAVYDDLKVYVGIDGAITDSVVPSNYRVMLCVDENKWKWRYVDDRLVGPDASWSANLDVVDDRSFVWDFSCGSPSQDNASGAGSGYKYVGTLDQFQGSDEAQDGYLYVSGTGSYHVDDPIYPEPVRITVPGFLRYLDYYPFAVAHDSSWESCNRTGGFTQQYASGSWQDRKNVATGSGDNHAWYWNGSGWAVCPEIGEK